MNKESQKQIAMLVVGVGAGVLLLSFLLANGLWSRESGAGSIYLPLIFIGSFWYLYASGKLGGGNKS
jgi:hypothetical protein